MKEIFLTCTEVKMEPFLVISKETRALKLSNFESFRALKISKYESYRAIRVTLFEIIRALKISINSIMWFKSKL